MTKMTEYKVSFVVYAVVQDMYDNTGNIECSGTTRTYDGYTLDDARISFMICARSPWDAYEHGLQMMETGNADFGKANVETWCLEHVTDGNKYWYSEDFNKKGKK